MDDISIFYVKTVNNGSDDSNPSVQIVGSHALCTFIDTVSWIWSIGSIWLILFILQLFNNCLTKVGPERAKTESYRQFLKTRQIIRQVWSVINFIILWTNPLYLIVDSPLTCSLAGLFILSPICYIAQLGEGMYHFCHNFCTTEALLTSLQEKMSHLITTEKPVVKWTAVCSHDEDEHITVTTHKEEQILDLQSWETSGVWLETLFGYKELSQDCTSTSFEDAARIKITVHVCAGDQETTLRWLAQRDSFKDSHRKGLHDDNSTFTEERHISKRYFGDKTVSDKKTFISIGYIAFTILGLGPAFRLILHLIVPEKHYIIEKCVYSTTHSQGEMSGFSNDAFVQENTVVLLNFTTY